MTSPSIKRPGQRSPEWTWAKGLQLLRNQAAAMNRVYGQYTREQAASMILLAIKLAPQAGRSFAHWYDLALPTLGWYKPGDKFKVDESFRRSMNDPAVNEFLSRELEALVADLDAAGVKFTMPDMTNMAGKYQQLARLAWDRMQKDAGIVPKPPKMPRPPGVPAPPAKKPPLPVVPSPGMPSLRGMLPLLVILGGIYYATKKGRR